MSISKTALSCAAIVGAVSVGAVAALPAVAVETTPGTAAGAQHTLELQISRKYARKTKACQRRQNSKSRSRCAASIRKQKLQAIRSSRQEFAKSQQQKLDQPKQPPPAASVNTCRRHIYRYSVVGGAVQMQLKSVVRQALLDSNATLVAMHGASYDSTAGIVSFAVDTTAASNEAYWRLAADNCPSVEGWVGRASLALNGDLAVERSGARIPLLNNPALNTSFGAGGQLVSGGVSVPVMMPFPVLSSAQSWGVVLDPEGDSPRLRISHPSWDQVRFNGPARSLLGLPATASEPDGELSGTLPLKFVSRADDTP